MINKIFLALLILFFSISLSTETVYGDGYAGTPKGFYEDIDPNAPDEDELPIMNKPLPKKDNVINENENSFHTLSDDDEIIIPETKSTATKDYLKIYNDLEPADFSYMHNIDPDQYYDMKDTTWSVYPLLRLNSPIYFKNSTIEPGYYLLTPRENNGKWYMLFKQNGQVVHIIPVYNRDYTPETFYDEHIPKPKLTTSQKIHMGFLDFIGNTVSSSKRKPPVQTYLEVNDLENYLVSIVIYYGNHKYSTIFRTIRL